MQKTHSEPDSLKRLPDVTLLTGLPKASIYRLEKLKLFPARVRLTERSVAWRLSEIEAWIGARQNKVDTGGAA